MGIARPDTVCVGLYAVEVLERAGLSNQVKPNIITFAESCEKTATLVGLGSVDAILGWRVFHYWQPDKIETILLKPHEVPRIGYIAIARSVFCRNKELADRFIAFLLSDEGKNVFKKWHYLASEDEARAFATKDTPVGGEWQIPKDSLSGKYSGDNIATQGRSASGRSGHNTPPHGREKVLVSPPRFDFISSFECEKEHMFRFADAGIQRARNQYESGAHLRNAQDQPLAG